ncbi:carbohydrate sulfotransferase 12 [Petromyzon marinus]|uniref:carbohydrate sulfotransferase 12 n=1 Tax=Petromyzon marinus TaxID=7757 RepID=UPI003F6EB010
MPRARKMSYWRACYVAGLVASALTVFLIVFYWDEVGTVQLSLRTSLLGHHASLPPPLPNISGDGRKPTGWHSADTQRLLGELRLSSGTAERRLQEQPVPPPAKTAVAAEEQRRAAAVLSQANIEEWERGYEKEATAEPGAADDDRLAREQARRRARVRHACDSPDLLFPGKNRTFDEIPNRELKHLIVDDRHGTVYCYVPKVACTNWKRIMIVLSGSASNNGTPYADPMDIPPDVVHLSSSHQVFNQFWRKYGKSGRSRMKGKLQRYKKFLFVRDPFVRIISAFRSKFEIPNQDFYEAFVVPMLRQYQNVSAPPATAEEALSGGQRLKFSSFVQYLLDPATEREAPFNEHWRQVYRLCHPCQVPYDFVGRLETQSEDAPYLLRLLQAQDELRFPPGFLNRTDDRWEDRWFAGIPLDWRQRLYKLYEPDFVLFGYPYPRQLLHG